jgi:hypothetical protein
MLFYDILIFKMWKEGMMEDILQFIPETMWLLIPIAIGWGFVLKDTEPEEDDNWLCKMLKATNWTIPYYLVLISWVNAAMVQFYPEKMSWFIVGQLVAFFSKYGYDLVIKPKKQ